MNRRVGVPVLALAALLSAGCAKERETAGFVNRIPYPHPSGWERSHGASVLAGGGGALEACEDCHPATPLPARAAPPCASCHPSYPHGATWGEPTSHGAYVTAAEVVQSECTLCHGRDLHGGAVGVACSSCHPLYPHDAAWPDPGIHGSFVLDQGGAGSCAPCHGSDFTGGGSRVACFQCHAVFPHPAGWGEPSAHGALALAQGVGGCASCHGDDFGGGKTGIACGSCHATFPHAVTWETAEDGSHPHADYVRAEGNDVCRVCHADLKAPAKLPVDGYAPCQYCHGR